MIVQCPKCDKKYDLDRTHLSRGSIKVRCPSCNNAWVIKAEFAKVEGQPAKKENKKDQDRRSAAPQPPKLLPIEDLITLRAIVGFLGEKPQFGWWDTNFLSETGLKFLNITFPRTALSAGVNSVTEAAKRLHDSRIGKGRVYHLFRMPEFAEQRISKRLLDYDSSTLLPLLKDKDGALEKLHSVTENSLESIEGPIQLGSGKNLFQLSYIQKVAKHYEYAFENEKQTFPYFTES